MLRMKSIVATIERWGKGQGVRLPQPILEMAQIAVGNELEVVVGHEKITLRKLPGKKFDLADLVSRIPRDRHGDEWPFGTPAGKEQW